MSESASVEVLSAEGTIDLMELGQARCAEAEAKLALLNAQAGATSDRLARLM